jgi:hypothetical protein
MMEFSSWERKGREGCRWA